MRRSASDEAERALLRRSKALGIVKVKADRSLQGRKVYLQRFTRFGQWVKMQRVILGTELAKRFLPAAPARAPLRAPHLHVVNQVGAGYLDGFSRTVVFKRLGKSLRIHGAG